MAKEKHTHTPCSTWQSWQDHSQIQAISSGCVACIPLNDYPSSKTWRNLKQHDVDLHYFHMFLHNFRNNQTKNRKFPKISSHSSRDAIPQLFQWNVVPYPSSLKVKKLGPNLQFIASVGEWILRNVSPQFCETVISTVTEMMGCFSD